MEWQEFSMALRSRVHILLADLNAQRARENLKRISVRQIAIETGIGETKLHRFVNGDEHCTLDMLDKLMGYFQLESLDQLLEYTEVPKAEG